MKNRVTVTMLIAMTAMALGACGGESKSAGPAVPASQGAGSGDEAPTRVCSLLTKQQVDTVIPGHDGGNDKDTSEASLLKDVTLEHCQYTFVKDMDLRVLDVFIWTATSDAGVASLPGGLTRCTDSDCRRLDIGDNSFATTRNGDPRLVVAKGRQYLEISLSAPDAAEKSAQLVELARTAAGKL